MKQTLGDRMKSYEAISDSRLVPKIPIVIRLDGNRFSKYTKKLKKPFDEEFLNVMSETMRYLCQKIQGCILGYTQSDEITLVLRNDQSDDTTPWFGGRVNKINSVASSIATAKFNSLAMEIFQTDKLALFDCRCFNVPSLTEAFNCVIFRQNDCIKNSISCATYYEVAEIIGKGSARKKMHGLSQSQQLELMKQYDISWDEFDNKFKYGLFVLKRNKLVLTSYGEIERPSWVIETATLLTTDKGKKLVEELSQ